MGVIHLSPLPGSPQHRFPLSEILDRALADAKILHEAGFTALIVENFGDAPFTRASLPPASVAAMAVIAERIKRDVDLPLGINALRNDAQAALGIAAAAGGTFIRINVHTGVYATDQGMIEGKAHQTLTARNQLGLPIAILADVHVKHATPIAQPSIEQAARDTAYRGLADALIVTGGATGEAVDVDQLKRVREAVPDRRLFVGSGATASSVAGLLHHCCGVIVGTSLKKDGDPSRPIDADLAKAFIQAVHPS